MWAQMQRWEQTLHDNSPTRNTCSDDRGRSGLSFLCLITGTDSYGNEHVLVASWPGHAFDTHNCKANARNASDKH